MSTPMTSSSALGARRQQLSETRAAERYLCFGQFQVDLQREELFKEGSRVRIPSKVFQVLLAFVERPGGSPMDRVLRHSEVTASRLAPNIISDFRAVLRTVMIEGIYHSHSPLTVKAAARFEFPSSNPQR